MRYRTRVTAPAAALIGTAAALTVGGTAQATEKDKGTPGPETLDDPVFPSLGNDGYRVAAYHLDLAYDATTRLVDATATLRIRTTQALTRLSLDALGLDIRSVRVAGRPAAFEQANEKLRITPARCRRRVGGLRPGPVRLPAGLALWHEDPPDARSPGLDGHAGQLLARAAPADGRVPRQLGHPVDHSRWATFASPTSCGPRCCGIDTDPCCSATVRVGAGMRMPSSR